MGTFGSTAANMFGLFPQVPGTVKQVYRWRRTAASALALETPASAETIAAARPNQ
jgi:hypothetical protein